MKFFLSAIYIFYFGLIVGVSFLATPVKFRASRLTLPIALEVGKETFHVFNKVEWGILILIIVVTFFIKKPHFQIFNLALFFLLAVGTFYLLPKLDQRIHLILQGEQLARSSLHQFYVWGEMAKLVLCFFAAFLLQWKWS
ncbi:MAG TPA: hypothetical protein PKC21_10815 [Oligoflexia bacterium]|nr:hypothetical protein [Oligoflexia bacterium]HMR25828.1 hypothetical protein [Oligoflexia bacterium]